MDYFTPWAKIILCLRGRGAENGTMTCMGCGMGGTGGKGCGGGMGGMGGKGCSGGMGGMGGGMMMAAPEVPENVASGVQQAFVTAADYADLVAFLETLTDGFVLE